jgi:hypothetical protein
MPTICTQPRTDTQNPQDDPQFIRVQSLAQELKQLLEHNDTTFDDDIIRRQMELLERWMECYCAHLVAPDTFSETASALISDMRGRLKLSVEEQQRLEGEGGVPSSKEQLEKDEDMLRAIRRSQKLLTEVETLFSENRS